MWVTREKAEWKSGETQVDVSAHVGYQRESRVEVGIKTGRCLPMWVTMQRQGIETCRFFCPCELPERKQSRSREIDR